MRALGGVLSTRTTVVAVEILPARSMAVAVSVWLPSATALVSQTPVPIVEETGGAGVRAMDSRRPSAASSRRSTPLPASAACASTDTICRTNAPEGGRRRSSAGATPSWVIVASTGNEVNPAPPALVANTVTRLSRSSGSGTTSDAVLPTSVRPRIGSTASATKTSTRASA
jgi:hypothetical protein